MFLLAGPGVVISTALLGLVDKFILPYDWNWSTSMLLGGLLSATDPVAVVALLRELGASKKLSTIIDGEALMNDGSAIVVFQLFVRLAIGKTFTAGDIISFLFKASLGAVALGLAFAIASFAWLSTVFNDYVIEITLTFTASYMCFFVANDVTGMSGVLATMTLGMFLAVFAKAAFTGESERSMHHFWEMIAYIANTLIFTLSGVIIAQTILKSGSSIEGRDWGYLLALYAFVQLSRAIVVLVLYPGLKMSGYGMNWREALVLQWSGLRGAVALSLALIVARIGKGTSEEALREIEHVPPLTQSRIVFLTGGVVFLTLIVNGTTTQFLLAFLGMNKTSETKKRVLEFTRYEMYTRAVQAFESVGEDEELGPPDWPTVENYVTCLKEVPGGGRREAGESLHPHRVNTADDLRQQHLQDTRLRFLHGVQAAYWMMLEKGRMSQQAALLLMQSVEEAVDSTMEHQALNDWQGVQPHVKLPRYLKLLRTHMAHLLPHQLLSWLTVDRLELAAAMSAAYLRAHRHAREQLRKFIGDSSVADTVIAESIALEERPRKFLEDVRFAFPQVLRIVKTKQVTFAILTGLREYVDALSDSGLLDQRESDHLHDALQKDLKNLMRSPPAVTMPTREEMLTGHPLFGALPPHLQKMLMGVAKEYHKVGGSVFYSEGDAPSGIWLITSGAIKWSSTATDAMHIMPSTLTHGATLGLYECLTGATHICTAVASTVVHCHFIDRGRVLGAMRSDPAVADFLWQESAMLVAKVVLPLVFAGLPTQQLRSLLVGTARLGYFPRGARLELLQHEVAVLLEGAVLPLDQAPPGGSLLEAPAGLSFQTSSVEPRSSSEDMLHKVLHYKVSTAARLLIVDLSRAEHRGGGGGNLLSIGSGLSLEGSGVMGGGGAGATHGSGLLHGASASPGGGSGILARHGSNEHNGLMRWSSITRETMPLGGPGDHPELELTISGGVPDIPGQPERHPGLASSSGKMEPSGSQRFTQAAMEIGIYGGQLRHRKNSWLPGGSGALGPASSQSQSPQTSAHSSSHPELLHRPAQAAAAGPAGSAEGAGGKAGTPPLSGGHPPLRATYSHGSLTALVRGAKKERLSRSQAPKPPESKAGDGGGGAAQAPADSSDTEEHVVTIDNPNNLFTREP